MHELLLAAAQAPAEPGLLQVVVLPAIVVLVFPALVVFAGVVCAVSALERWRRGRREPPAWYYPAQPPTAPLQVPTTQAAQPTHIIMSSGPLCSCGGTLQAVLIDSASGQPALLRCTTPGCAREAPVGPWAVFGSAGVR